MDTTGGGAAARSVRFGELCERFHEIRLRAYAHGLEKQWRELTTAADAPDLLERWQAFVTEVERRDAGHSEWTVRSGDDDPDESDDDWLDSWDGGDTPATEYSCPAHRCDRTRPLGLVAPRCWLFDQDMVPVDTPSHDGSGTADGGS